MKNINVNGIEVEVAKKKVKNIRLTIYPSTGAVRISAPLKVSDEFIRQFVESKLKWIEKHKEKILKAERKNERQYISGEDIYLWGRKYKLIVLPSINNKVEISGDNIILHTRENNTLEKRKAIVNQWYRNELKKEIPMLLEKWQNIMGVSAEEFGVKDMKTRWGTCNIRDKRVWINLRLARRPYRCLEYVVVHELTHLLERNHNYIFKAYMSKFLPEWPSVKEELNKFAVEYFDE